MSIDDYVAYLERYCTQFNLWPHIRLSKAVRRISQQKDGKHIVTVQPCGPSQANASEEQFVFDGVAVCSGLHVTPNIPDLPGIEHVSRVMHSSEFKSRADFGQNTSILILGCGETAMDLGYMAVTAPTSSVTMCHRNGFLAAPKVCCSFGGEYRTGLEAYPRHSEYLGQ